MSDNVEAWFTPDGAIARTLTTEEEDVLRGKLFSWNVMTSEELLKAALMYLDNSRACLRADNIPSALAEIDRAIACLNEVVGK